MHGVSNGISVSIVFCRFLLREAVNYCEPARDLRFLQLRILFPYRVSHGNARLNVRAWVYACRVHACVREPCDTH